MTRVYEETTALGAVCAVCAELTADQRLEVAETALELVVGLTDFGINFPFR